MESRNPSSYLTGFLTILALGILTWLEFQISGELVTLLAVIGVLKTALILQWFMHLSRLWRAH